MSEAPPTTKKPELHVLVYNVAKTNNVGNIIRSAVAFGATNVIVVGDRKIQTFGNHNTTDYIKFTYYDKLSEAVEKIHEKGFKIVGVEIGDKAQDVTTHPFQGNTVLMFGNEGHGMDAKQLAVCDQLVYIPQYGKGTASLNVSNAAAIVMHHFALWAKYDQQTIYEAKFVVDEEAKVTGKRPRPGETYQLTEADLEIRAARLAKKQKMAEVESNCSTNPSNTLPTGTGSSNGEATRNSNQGNDASSET